MIFDSNDSAACETGEDQGTRSAMKELDERGII
jgi:hypothetical protein